MIYLLYWFICAIASFMLLKTYITSNLSRLPSPPENIAQAMRNVAKRDTSDDVSYAPPDDCPDYVYSAVFWTVLLVINLFTWPLVLVTLIWWNINKQDFSDFRGL
jgi:uncharacterized membrane protein